LWMTGAVDAAVIVDVSVERVTAELTASAGRVLATVDAVTAVTGSLEQLPIKVALVRLAATVARCTLTARPRVLRTLSEKR